MMQTFAYEIAAAFFWAALLMGGSYLRGFFSHEILRGFKLAAAGLVLGGVGLMAYRALAPEPVVVVVPPAPDPAKQTQRSKRLESLRESDRKALAAAMAEEAAKPNAPTHISAGGSGPSSPVPVQGNRGQRIMKSVGRALHVVPKTQP
jgi:hypothetical protein